MAIYKNKKGLRDASGKPKHGGEKGKPRQYFFFTFDQIDAILKAIEADKDNPNRSRDHCIVTCAYFLGLRIDECAALEREGFKYAEDGVVKIRTLKQRKDQKEKVGGRLCPPWRDIPHVESHFVDYILDYLAKMKPDQNFLFPGKFANRHLSKKTIQNIFITYLAKAGLSNKYTFHAFRHARGVFCYERWPDDIIRVGKMLRHKSLKSTEVYIDLSPMTHSEKQEALEKGSKPIRRVS